MESFTDSIGLWRPYPSFGVFNVVDGQIQLIIMAFYPTTIFSAPIGQNPQQGQRFIGKEGQDFVVQQVCGSEWCLGGIQFGKGNFGVGIDKGLLIDTPYTLEGTDIKSVL